jgi:hypothetical protein
VCGKRTGGILAAADLDELLDIGNFARHGGQTYGRKPGDLKESRSERMEYNHFHGSQHGRLRTLEAIVWNQAD